MKSEEDIIEEACERVRRAFPPRKELYKVTTRIDNIVECIEHDLCVVAHGSIVHDPVNVEKSEDFDLFDYAVLETTACVHILSRNVDEIFQNPPKWL